MANKAPNISVMDFVEDLFEKEEIQHPSVPAKHEINHNDKAIMSQKVSSDFVTAIVEGKDPTTTIKESKKKEAPVPSPQSEIIEEEVRTVKQCVIEFKLLMAQARGLLEEMTTVGAGIGAGPPTKKKKKSTVEIIKKYTK